MDKYEYKLKTQEMLELMEDGEYSRAAEIADIIDWKRVRNVTMLMNVAIFMKRMTSTRKVTMSSESLITVQKAAVRCFTACVRWQSKQGMLKRR